MTTKKQDKKAPAAKPEANKASPGSAQSKESDSIGFLRAAEKAHIAVMDIPLDFFADLGMFPERVRSTKDLSRRFIGGMYKNLDSVSTKISNAFGAPGRFVGGLVDKLKEGSATPNTVRPKAKPAKGKSAAKKAEKKAKAKTTPAKAKQKSKAKVKANDAPAKPKAIVATPSRPNTNTGIH